MTSEIVLDASTALAWLFEDVTDARSDALDHALGDSLVAVVPPLWYYEIANAIAVAVRRQRFDWRRAHAYWACMVALPLELDDRSADDLKLLELSQARELTAYDAAYLDLARHRACPLATRDARLGEAAQAAGVALWSPPS